MTSQQMTRRSILQGWLAASAVGIGVPGLSRGAMAQSLPPTPACGPDDPPTLASSEGPFYNPQTPAKANFRPDAPGDEMTLVGFVVGRDCRPIPDALVDLWHADAGGEYDNDGFRLRGHQLADAQGRYVFETIVPGLYPGRTRHYHVKVQAPGRPTLTTQLYFPDESGNQSDALFDPRLLMGVEAASDGKVGRFDFVIDA